MATILEVTTKYCDKCKNKSYCYNPCPLVLATLYDLPCEQEIITDVQRKAVQKNDSKRSAAKN